MTEQPPPSDPWHEVSERWHAIGAKLRDQYRTLTGAEGPSEEELREAVSTLGSAARTVIESVGSALQDPQVRAEVKRAFSSLASALGEKFSELATELRPTHDEEDDDERPGPIA